MGRNGGNVVLQKQVKCKSKTKIKKNKLYSRYYFGKVNVKDL